MGSKVRCRNCYAEFDVEENGMCPYCLSSNFTKMDVLNNVTYEADAKNSHSLKLQQSIDSFFEKLEKYYPEHKVFALDSIDGTLRDKLSKLYKVAGFETVNEFLKAYGFEIISGDEVKKIRSFVLYTPGNEPDVIKSKVESMLKRLNEYYPNKIIPRGMQKDHKSLSQSVSGLYQWLGYDTSRDMLKAYGFDVQHGDAGRQENDYQDLINTLIE